jgi:outer membrane protein assembly factor BamB
LIVLDKDFSKLFRILPASIVSVKFDFIFLNSDNRVWARRPKKVGYLMYKTKTSIKKIFKAELFGSLFIIVLVHGFAISFDGQEKSEKQERQERPDLKKPFKKCWEYGAKNGQTTVIASDNELQLIIKNNNSSLISLDPSTRLENWKTEIRGQIQPKIISDEDNLFFTTDFDSNSDPDDKEKKEKITTLNSISLKTGITKWQEKTADNKNIEVKQLPNKELLFVTDDKNALSAIEKEDGTIRWKRNFPNTIISVESISPAEIKILTEDRFFRINAGTGDILDEVKIETNSAKNFILKEDHLLLGNSLGEVAKIIPGRNKNNVLWKIKTGGSISALIELENEVIISSLDNFLYLYSLESGKLKWKRRVSGRINQSPIIFGSYALVVNSADSYASVIDLSDGKVVNQIQIEEENYFSGPPLIFKNLLLLQTFRGIYFFSNSDLNCQ